MGSRTYGHGIVARYPVSYPDNVVGCECGASCSSWIWGVENRQQTTDNVGISLDGDREGYRRLSVEISTNHKIFVNNGLWMSASRASIFKTSRYMKREEQNVQDKWCGLRV